MPNNTAPKRVSKSLDSVAAAQRWLNRGVLPVPIKPGSKKPKGGKGWNMLKVTPDTIPRFFEQGDNIGGLWGEPSGWIIDVDLDWPEAAQIAPFILPETFIYGRKLRPATHYLYHCEALAGSKRYKPKKDDGKDLIPDRKDVIIEIRSTGSQSVLPPSVLNPETAGHPNGDRYLINHDVDFTAITARHLEELVNHIAAASLLIRYYPDSGARHDYVHCVTGALLWGGWPEDKARKLVHAILSCVDGKESDSKQRARTVENTIQHFRKGNRISGWKTLSQWLPGPVLKACREWLKLNEKVSDVPQSIAKKILAVPVKPELLKAPGLVGEIAEWSSKCSYLKQPIFDIAVGLMCTAVLSMNKYVVEGWDTPIQPYFMMLAPTSGGKESALENIYRFMKLSGLEDYAFQGFQSYHAMLDRLAEPPSMAVWLWDEAARRMKSAHRSQGSQDFQVITHLIGMYGRANRSIPGMPGRANSIPPLEHPFLTVAAAAQPSQMMETITDSDISTGLINRFVLFDVGDKVPEANLRRDHTFPARISDKVKRIRGIEPPRGDYPWITVKMEDIKVYSTFQGFDHEARQHAYEGGGGEMWGRANQNALILAGIVAIGINPRAPVITHEVCNWALEFVRWSTKRWELRVDEGSARTMIEKRSKHVERIIRDPSKHITKNMTEKYRRLIGRGLMPRGIISRLCRHMAPKELEDTLSQLTNSDLIACGDEEGVEVFWSKI